MDNTEFLQQTRCKATMSTFLNAPDLGVKVLKLLESETGVSFGTVGVVAGQSVATAIDSLLGLTHSVSYNDVDVFMPSKFGKLSDLFKWDSFLKANLKWQGMTDPAFERVFSNEFGLTEEECSSWRRGEPFPYRVRRKLQKHWRSCNSRMMLDTYFGEVRKPSVDSITNMTNTPYLNRFYREVDTKLVLPASFEVRSDYEINTFDMRRGMDCRYNYTLQGIYSKEMAQMIYTSSVELSETMLGCSVIDCSTLFFDKTAHYAQGIVEGFDINAVKVGVDLSNGKLVYAQSYLDFLYTRELLIESTNTPVQSLVRCYTKAETIPCFFNKTYALDQIKSLIFMTQTYSNADVPAVLERSSRMTTFQLKTYLSEQYRNPMCLYLGNASHKKAQSIEALTEHFDFVKLKQAGVFVPVVKNPTFYRNLFDDTNLNSNSVRNLAAKLGAFVVSAKKAHQHRLLGVLRSPERAQQAISQTPTSTSLSNLPSLSGISEGSLASINKVGTMSRGSSAIYTEILKRLSSHRKTGPELAKVVDGYSHLLLNPDRWMEHTEQFVIVSITPEYFGLVTDLFALKELGSKWTTKLISKESDLKYTPLGSMLANANIFSYVFDSDDRENKFNFAHESFANLLDNPEVSEQDKRSAIVDRINCYKGYLVRGTTQLNDLLAQMSNALSNSCPDVVSYLHDVASDKSLMALGISPSLKSDVCAVESASISSALTHLYRLVRYYVVLQIWQAMVNYVMRDQPKRAVVSPLDIQQLCATVKETHGSLFSESLVIEELLWDKELLLEGHEMHHCVGGYFSRVNDDVCRIIRFKDTQTGERATAEWGVHKDKNGNISRLRLTQIRAAYNQNPSDRLKSLNAQLLRSFNASVGVIDQDLESDCELAF